MWQNEEMSVEEKIKAVSTLKAQLELNFVSLGQLLSDMKRYKIYVQRGYKTFAEFVENEYNMAKGLASKLISTYELYIENLDKDEVTVTTIGFDKLNMIKPFVKEANFKEAEEWIEKAKDMPTAQLREEIKEIRDKKKRAKMTMKDVLIDQHIETMVTFFNCGRKELNFKMALYFQDTNLEAVREVVRKKQHNFEMEQIDASLEKE